MSISTEKADLSALRIDHSKRDDDAGGSSKKYWLLGTLAVILLGGGYFFFSGSMQPAQEVELTTAALTYPSSANAVLTASGYVVAQQKAAIASKATGRLVYLGVEEGDKVVKNQIIARIEDTDVTAALAQSRANQELAKADYDDAKQWLDRARTMFASGTMSKAELDAAEARFKRVAASIKFAEATARSSEVAVENTRIRAPFGGTVLTKNANVGEVVAPFAAGASSRAAVVTIADMSSLEVEADVSESNITRVTPGAPCEISLDAYPEVRYQGFVHKIVPTADRSKATVQTKVRFRNLDERVLPEMSAKVNFLSKEPENGGANQTPVITIPLTTIVTIDGKKIVYKVTEGVAHRTTIETGSLLGSVVEVRTGLKQGDRIILKPSDAMGDGQKVQTKQ
jgi:RND family efflux transporter MFP subunit